MRTWLQRALRYVPAWRWNRLSTLVCAAANPHIRQRVRHALCQELPPTACFKVNYRPRTPPPLQNCIAGDKRCSTLKFNPNMVVQTGFFPPTRESWEDLRAVSCNGLERVLNGGAMLQKL